ncbi:hypothetical protein P6166_12310 [Stenotrophomonas sp. HITSZ_GD]|uniref:hypothetical protein n=1 Tax=Stenotrophomonas sp. HITSZ_GD TaxID=3037248 RepID=UPI00240E919E|nr:hypothetical protein [Stenotrophomonas sp. HITSZ_GD]MDG2526139.1 hypothetical protein [Stenotrophomonas sp. HITSZ_GD]
MHIVTAVALARRPADVPGVRRYRVWWLEGCAEVVPACPLVATPSRAAWLAALAWAVGIGGAGLPAHAAALAFAAGAARALWLRHRARQLRRRGARPGPWVWAIDAESAACTARIRAAARMPRA